MIPQYVCIVSHADDLPGSPNVYGPFGSYDAGCNWASANGIAESRVEVVIIQDPASYGKKWDEDDIPF